MIERVKNSKLLSLAQKEEPQFLSLLLKDQSCLSNAIGSNIKPGKTNGHFWIPKNAMFYKFIYDYYKKYGKKLTRSALGTILDGMDEIEGKPFHDHDKASFRMYWDEVYASDTPLEDYNLLKEKINDRFIQWQAVKILEERQQDLIDSVSAQKDIVKELQRELLTIENMESDAYSKIMHMSEGISRAIDYVKDRRDHPDSIEAIKCGIKGIDDIFLGFDRGSYTVIGGFINGGKTTLMFNIAFNMAKMGYNVVYVSLEKACDPFYQRLLCLHAMADFNRIKRGGKSEEGLSDFWYDKLVEAANQLKNDIKPNMYIVQRAQQTTLSAILSDVESILKESPIDILVVDYLGVIGKETTTIGRPDLDEAMVSSRLQAFGKTHNMVTITGSQFKTESSRDLRKKTKSVNSEGDEAESIDVNTEDMAGSKMIAADADNVMACVLNKDRPSTKMFVSVVKARNNERAKTITLDFDGKVGRVGDPVFGHGQFDEIDDLIYDDNIDPSNISKGDIDSPEDLFGSPMNDALEKAIKANASSQSQSSNVSGEIEEIDPSVPVSVSTEVSSSPVISRESTKNPKPISADDDLFDFD